MMRRRALAHATEDELDLHPDFDLALVGVGHLAEEAAAALEIDHGHHGRRNWSFVEEVFGEGKGAAVWSEGALDESLASAATRTNTRDRKLHRRAARAIRSVEAHVLGLLAVPEHARNLGAAGAGAEEIAKLAVNGIAR